MPNICLFAWAKSCPRRESEPFFVGVLVALAGCLRGMQCGRSAAAVGTATTSAVVTGIVLIITSDAIIDIVIEVLGI